MIQGAQAGAIDGSIQLLTLRFKLLCGHMSGDHGGPRPTNANARERLGNQEMIPRMQGPGMFRFEMKSIENRPGHLSELDGPHFRFVNRTTRSIGGEDRSPAGLDDLVESHQSVPAATGTGAAHGIVAKHSENARDQFTIKALTNENHRARMAKINRARQDALMPEAEDFIWRYLAERNRRGTFFGNDLKAPGAPPDTHQRPHNARDDG